MPEDLAVKKGIQAPKRRVKMIPTTEELRAIEEKKDFEAWLAIKDDFNAWAGEVLNSSEGYSGEFPEEFFPARQNIRAALAMAGWAGNPLKNVFADGFTTYTIRIYPLPTEKELILK